MATRFLLRFLAIALWCGAAAAAAPAAVWQVATYSARGGTLAPIAGQAAAHSSGDLIVLATQSSGLESCIVTLRYAAASGAIAWRREACGPAGSHAVALAIDFRGDAIVAGNTSGTFRLLKYSGASGEIVWDRRFSGGGLEVAYGMAVPATGDIMLMGRSIAPSSEIWVARHRNGDGEMAWQQPIDAGVEVTPVGVAVDGSGNVFVAGNYRSTIGTRDWHVAKLAGSSGAVLWRKLYNNGPMNAATALDVDDAGDVIVTGIASNGSASFIRTVKSAGATGRTLWDATDIAAANVAAAAVRHDRGGNVIVTGSGNDDIRTLKYTGATGTAMWAAWHTAGGAGAEGGAALAVDGAGNVAVAGRSFVKDAAGAEIRTLKYAATGGGLLWTASYAGSTADDSAVAVVTTPDATYTVGRTTDGAGAALRIIKYLGPDQGLPEPQPSVQGLWWQSNEPGWGVNLTQQGDVVFATWFTYDEHGQGLWLVMSNGRRIADNTFEGVLYRTSGPAFNAQPFDAGRVTVTAVGTARLSFSGASNGSFSYEVNGVRGTKAIARQLFASPLPACSVGGSTGSLPNYQDLWWSPGGAESGWGLNIAHQGDLLFVTWFTYGGDGRGMWLVGSNVAKTGNATYAGTLYRTVGPPFSNAAWDPSQVAVAPAGHVTLVFSDADNGTFSYTLDGITQTKAITRQVFASPQTTCR